MLILQESNKMIGFVKPPLTPFYAAFWQSKPRQNVVNLADRNVSLYRAVMIDCFHPDYCTLLESQISSSRADPELSGTLCG